MPYEFFINQIFVDGDNYSWCLFSGSYFGGNSVLIETHPLFHRETKILSSFIIKV